MTDHAHRYLENLEEREEGGTPNILGAIRCGLVFHLWSAVSGAAIAQVRPSSDLAPLMQCRFSARLASDVVRPLGKPYLMFPLGPSRH